MSTCKRPLLLAVMAVVIGVGMGLFAGPAGAQRAAVRRVDPALEAYRSALETWMPATAKESLREVRLDGTAGAPVAPLAWIAADYAVRRYAATAMTALGHHPAAARLSGLPPVASQAAATAALRELRTIIEQVEDLPGADRAAERNGVAALRSARRAIDEASAANRPADPSAPPAEVSSDEHARQAMQVAAGAAEAAIRSGADRDAMIRFCVQNLTDMADQARTRSARPAR